MNEPKRILVIDDSEDIRDFYEMVLDAEGYEVRSAADAEQGFALARSWRPDLIILDVVMPGMNGLELLVKLRSDLAPPVPPVILCSGFDLTGDEALRRGAIRFLRKPMEASDLVAAVSDALGERPARPDENGRQYEHASAARAHAFDTASELVRRLEAHGLASMDTLASLAQPKIATVAAYIGIARGAMALVHGCKLEVLAATDDAGLTRGFDLGVALPQACEVFETGSALLLPDASVCPFAPVAASLGGIRFFGGVPLRLDGVPVGVVCLFDTERHHLEGDELAALELFGRRGSDLLMHFAVDGDAERLVRHGRGLVVREMFDELLDAELRILDRRGGSIELAVVDVPTLAGVEEAIARAPSPTRFIAGVVSPRRVALFKRAVDDSARRQVAQVVAELTAADARHADARHGKSHHAVGVVDLPAGGIRGLGARDLVHVASIALDRAHERGEGLRRVVIEEHAG